MTCRAICPAILFLVCVRGASGQGLDHILADINSDGNVDFMDFNTLANHHLQKGGFADGDVSGDGFVSFLDFLLIGEGWGQSTSPRAAVSSGDDVVLIAHENRRLLLYSRDAVRLNGFSILSDGGKLRPEFIPTISTRPIFDFPLVNTLSEVAEGSLVPKGGQRVELQGDVLLLAGHAGVDPADLLFLYGTEDGTFEGPVVPSIPGDVDLDGKVQFSDFLLLSNSFGHSGEWGDGDFDGDGNVEFADFLIQVAHFGESLSLQVALVPEPGGLILLFSALTLLSFGRPDVDRT